MNGTTTMNHANPVHVIPLFSIRAVALHKAPWINMIVGITVVGFLLRSLGDF